MARWSPNSSAPSPSPDRPAPGARADRSGRPALLIRPTGAGWAAILLLLAAGLVAVNAANNLLYLVVACLLALLALSGVLGHLNLRGLAIRAAAPEEVYAGLPSTLRLEIANPRRHLPAFLISLAGETALEIPPGRAAALTVTVTFPSRGRTPFPALDVLSEFPFGFVRRGWRLRPGGTCLVHPRPLPVPWEMVERAEREGELLSRQAPGVGGDYRGTREYAPGDGLARVEWKSWLRLRRLRTKEFDAEGASPVLLSWDAVPGPGIEERLGQLTWLVRTAMRRGRAVGLLLPGRAFPAGSGAAHRAELLAALALFRAEP